jgi:hypothetical protein
LVVALAVNLAGVDWLAEGDTLGLKASCKEGKGDITKKKAARGPPLFNEH